MNYYNEFDPNAAQWLRNLIARGAIPDGYVDDRSILDVKPADLAGFTQCHFFAGIGGWSLALALAGISPEVPLWTGSPPCQPFSVAGLQKGSADPRHLAPAFLDLIGECRPRRVYGEQVAAAVNKDDWLDALCIELEGQGYLFGASVLPAAGIGAAHKRERLFFGAADWMADADSNLYRGPVAGSYGAANAETGGHGSGIIIPGQPGGTGGAVLVADSYHAGQRADSGRGSSSRPSGARDDSGWCGAAGNVDNAVSIGQRAWRDGYHGGNVGNFSGAAVDDGSVADSNSIGLQRFGANGYPRGWEGQDVRPTGLCDGAGIELVLCRDGKTRPIESGISPLAYGVPKSVGRGKSSLYALASRNRQLRLKGYGNAIVPQIAAQHIVAFEKSIAELVN